MHIKLHIYNMCLDLYNDIYSHINIMLYIIVYINK